MDTTLTLIQLLGALFPKRCVVSPDLFAVCFPSKRRPTVKNGEAFWYWPYRTVIKILAACPDPVEMEEQTMTTIDGKTVSFVIVITTQVQDPVMAAIQTEDLDRSIQNDASVIAAEFINSRTLQECIEEVVSCDLTEECNERSSEYGVKFLSVEFSNFSESMSIKHYGTLFSE
jgi:regulator of protease activity HflC (stomatin/prohibitin superfamily)